MSSDKNKVHKDDNIIEDIDAIASWRWTPGTVVALCIAVVALVGIGIAVTSHLLSADDQGVTDNASERRLAQGLAVRPRSADLRLVPEQPAPATEATSGAPRQVRNDNGALDLASGHSTSYMDLDDGARRLTAGSVTGSCADERLVRGQGSRDPVAVRARIRALRPAIQQCYERRMRTHGQVQGVLEVVFSVSPGGAVHNSAVRLRSSLDDRVLASCVQSRLSSVRLGRGRSERYAVPLRFVATQEG